MPYYCVSSSCYRTFRSPQAVNAHCRDSRGHPYCGQCERAFATNQSLHQHYQNSPRHAYCTQCERAFVHQGALQQHIRSTHRIYCARCNRRFITNYSLQQHISAVHPQIDRYSSGRNALVQHSASAVHHDRPICCPLCGQAFRVPSSIPMHIESGACQGGITRHHVTAAVHNMNIIPSISASRLLTGPTNLVYSVQPTIYYLATKQAFTGTAFECYFCRRQFRQLRALSAHLNSAAHDKDNFKCPNRRCNKEFTLISGLVQHIESGACGLARFGQVQRLALALTAKFSRLLTN
ncbi:hypothetical protein BDN72DRAFT_832306 [Pluteus cervinus]|uniref:Uncharacterized protein n=1 Tax=Pluteus cervinus TaxID=181527 RepID=A0ACD3BBN6_9AGAR|nr:hypothetical protein BDN72DRAFT_832306 [Pluteus cervinus]